MKIGLYYRHIEPADQAAFDTLLQTLAARGVETATLHDGDSADGCNFLLSVGGDGTLLNSVQFIRTSNPANFPPIVGVNFGHLGFLTTAGKDNLAALVDELLEGRFSIEERTLLNLNDGSYALNEVFFHRREEATLLRTRVMVDDDFVATYAGDGVIIATPTGSTAYSLSCGGPILTPTSRCFVITPISAHTLTLRPIIVPDTAHIRLTIEGEQFTLGVDSRRSTCSGNATVDICRAPFTVRLIRLNTQNFFSAIRDKLMWGTEARP